MGIMPTLSVKNGYHQPLDGLGKITAFQNLSQKRVTKATREALRRRFGRDSVVVSCSASFTGTEWTGECTINDEGFTYRISTS